MPAFLEIWLPLVACTTVVLFYKSFTDHDAVGTISSLLAIELGSLGLWAIYWMVLYPAYFTPFRHLPTPPVSKALLVSKYLVA